MKPRSLFALFLLLSSILPSPSPASPRTALPGDVTVLSTDVLAATRGYAETQEAPVLESGFTRQYPYGLETPILRCAPLRVCAIRLEEGETVWQILSGDTSQWQIHQAVTGPSQTTPVVAVKPLLHPQDTCNKTTNLLITTDRRIYSVVLYLPPCPEAQREDRNPERPFDTLISFYYPQETLLRWSREAEEAKAERQRLEDSEISLAPTQIADLNWSYSFRSKGRPRFPWKPIVFDDGERTYLKLPPDADEAPAVFAYEDGELSLLNSRFLQGTIVVDRTLPRLLLSLPGSKPGKNRSLLVINEKVLTDD